MIEKASEKEAEECKQELVRIGFDMLIEAFAKNENIKGKNKKALVKKKIEWSYFEKYGDAVGATFIMKTNKGLFLFKAGNGNLSYTPLGKIKL